jgi:hypothetical protein
MMKLGLVFLALVVMVIAVSEAHAYTYRTVIRSNGSPYTWASNY